MARFNEILVGRFNRFLQKLMSMKGGPVAAQLASEVQPIISFFNGVENRYLESWDRFAVFRATAGVAGQQTATRLRNPTGSNVVGVIEKLTVEVGAIDSVFVDRLAQATDLFTIAGGGLQRQDNRGRPGPTLVLSENTAGIPTIAGTAFDFASLLAGQPSQQLIFTRNQEITLLPGDAVQLRTNTAATSLSSAWYWRERLLEESERA
jgi:hypothetical protein